MKAKPSNRIIETLTWAATLLLFVPVALAADKPEARDTRPGYARGQAERPASPVPERRAPMPEPLRRKVTVAPEHVAKAGSADRAVRLQRVREVIPPDPAPILIRGPLEMSNESAG